MRALSRAAVAIAAAAVLASCAASPAQEPAASAADQAAVTRVTLTDAASAAKMYGQAHLGHFLDVRIRDLRAEGLTARPSVDLRIRATHDSYCIVAINEALPSIHPWATATVSSRTIQPSPDDRCAGG